MYIYICGILENNLAYSFMKINFFLVLQKFFSVLPLSKLYTFRQINAFSKEGYRKENFDFPNQKAIMANRRLNHKRK